MLYIKSTDLDKRMSQVRTSTLLKRFRRSSVVRNCACFDNNYFNTTYLSQNSDVLKMMRWLRFYIYFLDFKTFFHSFFFPFIFLL